MATGARVEGAAPSGIGAWATRLADSALELNEPQAPAASPDSPPTGATSPTSSGPDTDINVLIEREHDSLRRQFDALSDLSDLQELQQAWTALADLLEIHASNEEIILYPMMVRAAEDMAQEAEHAVRDHNTIRHGVHAVAQHPAGSDSWWRAVRDAQ